MFAPFAVISGVRSLRRIRGSGGAIGGQASAAAGLIAGALGLAVIVFGVTYWIVAP